MNRMVTLSSLFKLSAFGGTAALLLSSDPDHLAIWGVFAASAASVLTNWINRRHESKQREQQHAWDREEREAKAAEVKAEIERAHLTIRSDVRQVGEKADRAYDAANHVSEKIAALASRPVVVTLPKP
jgi:Flp pilus assembly protein TadB